tara:strand:- start:601 stop:981 length:381 start_codon:yes stop_codon:yes gene_type:complete
MMLRELLINDWDGYGEDLTVTPWALTTEPNVVEATASIAHYHGERFKGETVSAVVLHDRECGSITVTLKGGEGWDNSVQLSTPTDTAMLNLLNVLACFESRGGSQWEWCAAAWLAYRLVESAGVTA